MSPKKSRKRYYEWDDDEFEDDEFDEDLYYVDLEDAYLYERGGTRVSLFEDYATPSDAIIIKGPIYAVNKRGEFGTQWWGKQWIAAMNALQGEGRLDRGKSYARTGKVLELQIGKGMAYARVQGSRPRPYETAVELKPFTDQEWTQALTVLASQLIYTAKLLAGEMPSDIEDLFKSIKLSLFPRSLKDISFQCTCPDAASPCKHAAAIYYLLAEQIDENPFVLFHLRGRTKEQVLAALRGARSDEGSGLGQVVPPIDADLAQFWQMPAALPTLNAPSLPDKPLIFQELGDLPMDDMKELLSLYQAIGRAALETLTPDEGESSASEEAP
ncbi:MAG: hypothetical protein KF716_34330 [Anaerolineae bacterium]|nr:hypothetical protein [Anaerolineae bacterium]